jgi:hypothetical protein
MHLDKMILIWGKEHTSFGMKVNYYNDDPYRNGLDNEY